jgi:hypothetical protein
MISASAASQSQPEEAVAIVEQLLVYLQEEATKGRPERTETKRYHVESAFKCVCQKWSPEAPTRTEASDIEPHARRRRQS